MFGRAIRAAGHAQPWPGYYADSRGGGIDATGRFMARYYEQEPGAGEEPAAHVAVLWDNDVPQRLDLPGLAATPTAVNEDGWVVGYSIEVRHPREGEQWVDYGWGAIPGSGGCTVQRLPLLAGWPAGVAVDPQLSINAEGEVVGTAG